MKQNRVGLDLLTPDERASFIAVGADNLEFFLGGDKWIGNNNKLSCGATVYRLRPDYQPPKPEPKVVKCEVKIYANLICYSYNSTCRTLCNATDEPNFSHFEYKGGSRSIEHRKIAVKVSDGFLTAECPKFVVFIEQGE